MYKSRPVPDALYATPAMAHVGAAESAKLRRSFALDRKCEALAKNSKDTHARFATSRPRARGGEQRKQSAVARAWDAGSVRLSPGPQALWWRPPAPAAWAAGERRGYPYVSTLLTVGATRAQEKEPSCRHPRRSRGGRGEAAGGGEAASRTAKPHWGGEGKPSGQRLFFSSSGPPLRPAKTS
jgi:hypothetical protein